MKSILTRNGKKRMAMQMIVIRTNPLKKKRKKCVVCIFSKAVLVF